MERKYQEWGLQPGQFEEKTKGIVFFCEQAKLFTMSLPSFVERNCWKTNKIH